ncbi:MAG: hypothetical protein K8R23_02830 [Chthoniobacter sp.]|nr:hypothetical protein [Chthoniobacter sp.]
MSTAAGGGVGDGGTLYITPNTHLLRVKTETKGAGWQGSGRVPPCYQSR